MGVTAALARVAAGAAVPVFPVVGVGGREVVQDLALRAEVRLVDAPRPADVLLLAGRLPDGLAAAADAAHDAMSHPRTTVRCTGAAAGELPELLTRAHRELLSGDRASDPPSLPDEDPNRWRGEGPYGQGGSGMTGGVPYGRPMADRADDRDGLTLDQLPVTIGPLFRGFPPGLTLDVALQGDVLQDVQVAPNPFDGLRADELAALLRPFVLALHEPVPVVNLELARARHHLRWLAEALRVHGLSALSERALRWAHRAQPGDGGALRRFARRLRHTRVLGWATRGVGVIAGDALERLDPGPVARAAGASGDVRSDDPAYRRLGFEPVVGAPGDASARWQQRLAEAGQALDLAERAGQARTGGVGEVEAPGGRLTVEAAATRRLLELLDDTLVGMEWGEAVTTITSLAVDLEEAAVPTRAAPATRAEEPT